MIPCKHLDFSDRYAEAADLREIVVAGQTIRYWQRKARFDDNCSKCQFCAAGRGRINKFLDCYEPGYMSCYEPATPTEGDQP